MAITTLDGYIAANKQIITFSRSVSTTSAAAQRFSTYYLAGDPGAGVLTGTNTANGVLLTSSTAGFPAIQTTAGDYYLSRVGFTSGIPCNLIVQDLLWKAGAYAFNANVTLTAQPSIAARVPGGNYNGVDIYFEGVTTFTGIPTVNVTYTNEAGVTGRTAGATSLGVAPIAGRLYKINLQSGDKGVQKIESVVVTVSTAGTFNLLLVRDLFIERVNFANQSINRGLDGTGMAQIFPTSALNFVIQPDALATGIFGGYVEIASG